MESTGLIFIGLVDDTPPLRDITANLLTEKGFSIVFQVLNGAEALQRMEESKKQPDVCIIEEDFEAANLLLTEHPDLKVLISSTNDNKEKVSDMLNIGVSGYILKYADPDEFSTAVVALSKGKKYFSVGVSDIAAEYFSN